MSNIANQLYNRCKAIGEVSKGATEIKFLDGRFVIYEQGHPIAFIYPDKMIGTPEIIEAILGMFERDSDINAHLIRESLLEDAEVILSDAPSQPWRCLRST
jgi:hypothetical protein